MSDPSPASPARTEVDDLVIETRGLRKTYRGATALDGLDLAVRRGGVHGFLGPNGAGKTTTIELLVGLSRPTAGEMFLFGLTVPQRLNAALQRVGALVEGPAFQGSFTGRHNLQLLARQIGLPRARVDAALEQVGLQGQARRRYGQYSLGAKQRLGIAAALLKEPDLVILDEPTNGLDPAGIRDIRETVRRLGESGVTVLLSSHNLAEVQQTCDEVTIVNHGKRVATGSVSELIGEQISRTRVEVADLPAARDLLVDAGHDVTMTPHHLIVAGHDHPEQISRLLAEQGHYVHELSAVHADLESFFLELTGERLPPQGETETTQAAS